MRASRLATLLAFALVLTFAVPTLAQTSTSTPSNEDLQATISALETQVAKSTPSPTPKPKITPTATSKYSGSVQSFVDEDSALDCDRIGWNMGQNDFENLTESKLQHHASCTDDGMFYAAVCARTTDISDNPFLGPADGNEWLICIMAVANMNAQFGLVSPFDFAIIDSSNRRYETSFMAYGVLDQSAALQVTTLSKDQNTQGAIVFEVPKYTNGTLRLEIGTTTFGLSEPGVIILDPLPRA